MIKFNSPLEQICYIAVSKEKGEAALKNAAILLDHVVYEYQDNLTIKDNEIILEVILDLSNMFDLTNNNDFNSIKNVENMIKYIQNNNKNVLRYVDSELSAIYKIYHIKYRILDSSAIIKISKI